VSDQFLQKLDLFVKAKTDTSKPISTDHPDAYINSPGISLAT